MTDVDEPERVVVLAPAAIPVLMPHGLELEACRDVADLVAALTRGVGCAVIAYDQLTDPVLNQLRDALRTQAAWSDVPLIVLGADLGCPKVTELGNVLLLEAAAPAQALVAAVRVALRGRRRQYEARAAIRQRGQFLAMLGHELRNPLGAIVLATELDVASAPSGVLGRRMETIARQAHHLARLVDDLLDVARVISGRIRLRRQPAELHAVLIACIEALEAAARDRSIRIKLIAGPPARIDGDSVRLEQVFSNLLTNAIKYSPDGSTVEVSITVTDGMCEVRVRDEGIGIEPAMAGRIFDLFTQADGTLDRSRGGMGIGLTLVKQLVELHDGTIAVHSRGLGTGTEFAVRLPLAAAAPVASAPAPVSAPRGVDSAAVRVVLVDDNEDIRELSRAVLENLGCIVEDAADGPTGLACILREVPDLALVDVGLPGLDGFGVAAAVREALGAGPLLVAITGYGQPKDRDEALAAGFDVHLTKPVHTVALRAMVERARLQRVPSQGG